MAVATVAQTLASQEEWVRPLLENLTSAFSQLWKRLKPRTDVKPVSNRPARIPFELLSGGKFRVGNFDNADMGVGSSITEEPGYLSCVSFLYAWQYSALSEWSTDSDQKAIKSYVSLTNQRAAEGFAGYLDAALQGDGSNTLDTVVSTTTNGLVVNNANQFQDNQDVDCWTAVGGTFIATVTVLSKDILTNTIWLTGAVPGGVTGGTVLFISGSAGVANSGLAGLKAYQVSGNAGTYLGISRSAFPGKFSTPYINVGGSITPSVFRALEAQVELLKGVQEADENELMVHCNVDVRAAWENNAILVQSVIQNQVQGDESVDMLKRRAPTVMAGREMLVNEHALPGRFDLLALKHWFRIETKPLDRYTVGGQTLFPAYGASGGLMSSLLFYIVLMMQVANGQPGAGAYGDHITIPKGYFGH